MERSVTKQTEIPGTERQTIPEVEEKAAIVHAIVQRRLSIQAQEKEATASLLAEMKAHNLEVHIYTAENGKEMRIKVKTDQKVSVRVAKNVDDEDDEGSHDN
jgi:hypothetical protein